VIGSPLTVERTVPWISCGKEVAWALRKVYTIRKRKSQKQNEKKKEEEERNV
jgi:hypothetical protein